MGLYEVSFGDGGGGGTGIAWELGTTVTRQKRVHIPELGKQGAHRCTAQTEASSLNWGKTVHIFQLGKQSAHL
jgi:hypothetical protein